MSEELKPFQHVLVRDKDTDKWDIDIFHHIAEGTAKDTYAEPYVYRCFRSGWEQCLPYDGNEHLFGTTDSPTPPEPEFRFGDKVEVRDTEEEDWKQALYLDTIEADYPYRAFCRGSEVSYCYKYCRHANW